MTRSGYRAVRVDPPYRAPLAHPAGPEQGDTLGLPWAQPSFGSSSQGVLPAAGMAFARTFFVYLPLTWLAQTAPWTTEQARAATPDISSQISIGLLQIGPPAPYTQAAMARLNWELRQRTSIKTSLTTQEILPNSRALMQTPVLIWRSWADPGPLSDATIVALRSYLRDGGTLLIDAHDSDTHGPFASGASRELARILTNTQALALPTDHVVFKSFYLVDNQAGRHVAGGPALGIIMNHRLAVLVIRNDLLGAFSPRADGGWALAVADGQQQRREMALRMAINYVMYALCLDYKEDQVHLPFILRRRS